MSLYADYCKELGYVEVIENDQGFATFRIMGTECYIQDIYVKPEFRRTKEATKLADIVAEKAKYRGCTYLSGTVNTAHKDATGSMKALIDYGFKFARSTPDLLWFVKQLWV